MFRNWKFSVILQGDTDIKITFIIRGHSYLECDKNVGLWNIKAPMEIPKDFEQMVKLSQSKLSPFTVVGVTERIVLDWNTMLLSKYALNALLKLSLSNSYKLLLAIAACYNIARRTLEKC